MTTSGDDTIGARYTGDAVEALAKGDRCMVRITKTHLTLDPEVTFVEESGTIHTFAPWGTGMATPPTGRLVAHELGGTTVINLHRILSDAMTTGAREYDLTDARWLAASPGTDQRG